MVDEAQIRPELRQRVHLRLVKWGVSMPSVVEDVLESDLVLAGPLNLASMGAQHASEMFARNVYNFTSLLLKDGTLVFDWDDELLAKTVWPERASTTA